MSFETPVPSRLSVANVASPLRKKSILALVNQESPSTDLNDDDAERKERRQKLRAPHATSTPDVLGGRSDETRRRSVGLGTVSGLSAAQLAEHYANCIKMSTENKITVKNAFNLQLIDYMTYMLQKHDKQMEDFQVASCTLDASTKIYSYRVDSVHSDVVQMASGLGRSDSNKRKTNDADEDNQDAGQEGGADGNDSDGERQRTKVPKKKKRNKAVIAVKKETLLRKQKNFKSLDTFITRLSANLAVSQAGDCPFLCSIKNSEAQSVEDSSAEVVLDLQSIPDLSNRDICPAFADFSLKGWRPEDDPSPPESTPAPPTIQDGELAFDMNRTPEPIPDYDPGDDNHFDDDVDDNNDGDIEGMYAAPEVGFRAQARFAKQRENIVNLQDHLSTVPLEYSYFQTSILSLWAGPNHWKIKPVRKGAEKDERCAREKKKRQKKLVVLDYNDIKEFSQGSASAIELTKKTFAGWSKDRHLLPNNLFSKPESFFTLFLRPNVRVNVHDEFSAAEVDDAVPDYQYDNPADKSDFCPNLPTAEEDEGMCDDGVDVDMDAGSQDDDDVEGDPNLGEPMECDTPAEEQGAFTGDNLVEAPNKIARSYIPYQMRAKKVDMKKLKGAIWEILTESRDANKENISNVQEDMLNESRKIEKASTFSEVYRKVPTLLPTKMAENISCGLAFVALLHLANEKCLQVDGVPDMTDLNIKQG